MGRREEGCVCRSLDRDVEHSDNHDTAGVQNRLFLHYKDASSYGGKKQNEKVLLAAISEDYAPKGVHIFQYYK